MHFLAIICLAALAAAKPQGSRNDAVTTVTERSYTIRGEADKYYGTNNGFNTYSNGVSGYNAFPSYASSTAAPARAYQTYFQQAPAFRSYQDSGYHAFQAPAFQSAAFQSYQAPGFQSYPAFQAFQAPSFQAVTAAPALSYAAAPAFSYAAAPEAAFPTAPAAPALAFPTATVAPALAFPTATVAPLPAFEAVAAPQFAVRQDYGTEAKVYKHVYAFAAPEEPATRAVVRVEAPISKRKHYKLVFIKAPSHQTIVDSDITLPAQEEEKTLIYVLSKDGKQVQPEVRIKQAEASKHAKPEVFFLKYKNEAEAQAIASSTISGQTADVPADGEIISDGSVSVLGQNSGAAFSGSNFETNNFQSGANNFESPIVESSFRSKPTLVYRSGFSNQPASISTVSTGSVGIVPVTQAPIVAAPLGYSGYSTGFSYGRSIDNEEPANVAVQVTSEPSDVVDASTPSTVTL